MLRSLLLRGTAPIAYVLRAPDDGGAGGGGGAGAGAASPPGGAEPAAAAAAAADPGADGAAAAADGAAAAAAKPTSILDSAKPPADQADGDGKPAAAKPGEEGKPGEQPKPKEGEETPEQKAEREKQEGEAKKAETLKSYEALKLPDGVDPADPAFVDFKEAAAQHGLTPEVAQSLVDTVAPKLKEAVEAPYNAWADMQEKWIGEIKADPEIGGNNFEPALGLARKAVDRFGGEKLLETLAFTGAGNNPEVIRFLSRVGKELAEGSPATGRAAPAGKKPISEIMYPTMQKQE